jgi:hypothetical protein
MSSFVGALSSFVVFFSTLLPDSHEAKPSDYKESVDSKTIGNPDPRGVVLDKYFECGLLLQLL